MEEAGQGDNVDARQLFGLFKPPPASQPTLSGLSESEDYFMKYPKIGTCHIFNHKVFLPHTKLVERKGTDADVDRLHILFKKLDFDVDVYHDLKVRQIQAQINIVSKKDYSEYSCFVCCILTHGDEGLLYAKDGKYLAETVFSAFSGDVCPSLAGKPKIFFIQACQGRRLDDGVNVTYEEIDRTDSSQNFRIPSQADFLIAYSTVRGFGSLRDTVHGSWFIQALCGVLEKHAKDKDLLEMLTIVNRRVAYDYLSYNPTNASVHMKKQVPCVTSTLTRRIVLSPK